MILGTSLFVIQSQKLQNLCENTTSHCKRRLSKVSIDKKSNAAKYYGVLVFLFSYIITYQPTSMGIRYSEMSSMATKIYRCLVEKTLRKSWWPHITFLKYSSKPWQKKLSYPVFQLLKYLASYYEFIAQFLKMTIGPQLSVQKKTLLVRKVYPNIRWSRILNL